MHRTPGCHGRPVTGSHSHPREEEFSHRLTQQGSLSQCGEVSTAPLPECLRNAIENENALLSRSGLSCIVAVIPTWGVTQG